MCAGPAASCPSRKRGVTWEAGAAVETRRALRRSCGLGIQESGFVGPRGAERLQRRNAVRPAAGRPRGRAPGPVGQHQLVPGGRRLQRPAPGPPLGPVRRAPGERPAGPGRGRGGPGGEPASRGRELSFARGDLAGGPPALRGRCRRAGRPQVRVQYLPSEGPRCSGPERVPRTPSPVAQTRPQ